MAIGVWNSCGPTSMTSISVHAAPYWSFFGDFQAEWTHLRKVQRPRVNGASSLGKRKLSIVAKFTYAPYQVH